MNPRILGIIGGIALIIGLLSPLMMGSSKKVEQLYQAAEDLRGRADYEGAIEKYEEALVESTKRGVKTEVIDRDFTTLAHYRIAVCYSRLAEQSGNVNYYDSAIEHIEKVIPTATVPKHQEGLIYLWGHILYRSEQFELAEPKFMHLIERFPNSPSVENAWYAIGQLNFKLQNYEDSRQAFKVVLYRFPISDFKDDAQHLIAQSFLNESNYEQAYQEFDKIATEEFKNYPDLQAEAMYKAAYSLNQLGWNAEAIRRYTHFITQFPESQYVTAAYFDQGAIYARQKDYDNARVNYELALQNTADRTLQAEIQSILEKLADADNRLLAKIKLADLLRAEKRFEEAAVQYQAVVEGNPSGEYADDALYLVGLCYYQAAADNPALLASAEMAFKRVITDYADSPNAVEAYYGLALTYRYAAQKQNDTRKWDLILHIVDEANSKYASSDNPLFLKTLGHIELIKATAIENSSEEVDVDALLMSLKRIVENTGAPEDARSRSQLKIGHTYYSAKRYDEALAEYLAFVQNFPDSDLAPNAQYQAAVCHYQIAQAATDAGSKQLSLQNVVNAAEKVATLTEDADNLISANYTAGLAKLGLDDNKGAADSFKAVTALEGQTEDEARKVLIFQARTRLAELNGTLGDHAAAVQEYQYIIEHTDGPDIKGRSYFAMAFAQEEQLRTYPEALMSYQNAIELVEDPLVKAQSYYRMGLIYQDHLKQPNKALDTFQTLIGEYSGSANATVASMVADAGIRCSTLYVELGRLDEAIAEAVEARDRTMANPQATVAEKAAAQYNIGFLYSHKARSLFSTEVGTDLQPYIDASRQAAGSFFEVTSIAAPVEKADKQMVIPYVQNSLFQAGQIYYSIGIGVKFPEDLVSALIPLTTFVSYVDKGIFPRSDDLRKNTETALNYLAASNFELGWMQVGLDGEMSEKAVNYFLTAGDVFRDMVRRYPNANDVAFWQYQVGESHYAAGQLEKAIEGYEKVRTVNAAHKSAPESLYAILICAHTLSEAAERAGDEGAKHHWYNRLFEVNEVLATEYPDSLYTADARAIISNVKANKPVGKAATTLDEDTLTPVWKDSQTDLQGWLVTSDLKFVVAAEEKSKTDLQTKKAPSSKTGPIQPQQIAQKALNSTVLVVIEDAYGKEIGFGSGFFISNNQIVSNWHVVEGAVTGYAVQVEEGIPYKIEGITAKNVKQDLVILKVSGVGRPLVLGNSNTVQIGDPIYVTGNPKGWTGTFSEGIIGGFQISSTGKRLQFSAPVSHGSSGGPLLNNKGEVIGIVYATHGDSDAENLNLAIPVNYLKVLFK